VIDILYLKPTNKTSNFARPGIRISPGLKNIGCIQRMKSLHPTLKTLEEFCKYYEQDTPIAKQRLYRMYEIALKEVETRRARDKRRYQEKKQKTIEDHTISIQTEPEPEPEPVPEPTAPLASIPEEVPAPPPKVKRPSFTIPIPTPGSLVSHSVPAAQFPTIISDTKKKREVKRAPSLNQ
jgi:hypothetical protein